MVWWYIIMYLLHDLMLRAVSGHKTLLLCSGERRGHTETTIITFHHWTYIQRNTACDQNRRILLSLCTGSSDSTTCCFAMQKRVHNRISACITLTVCHQYYDNGLDIEFCQNNQQRKSQWWTTVITLMSSTSTEHPSWQKISPCS